MKETRSPTVDGRRRSELREAAIGRARSYAPQWEPDAGDVGTALLSLFADVAADVTARLDRTPEKHRVAFFDALGFDRDPPQPARLPLVFQVAEGLTENVAIPAGTQAVAPPEDDGTEQTFEIPDDEGFEATPARLDAVYSVSPDHDAIFEHGTAVGAGAETQLFSGTNQQEHVFYLGHTDFFTLTPQTEFEVRINGTDVAVFDTLRWEYYGAAVTDDESIEEWHLLPRRPRPETTGSAVTLRFKLDEGSEFVETTLPVDEETDEEPTVTEIETRWIRCVSPASLDENLYETRVSSVSLSLVSYDVGLETGNSAEDDGSGSHVPIGDGGSETRPSLEPDILLANDMPLRTALREDTELENVEPLYPFGEMPLPLDAFYIASDEAFSKNETMVKLIFDGAVTNTAPPPDEIIPDPTLSKRQIDLSWEYWNGSGWAYLELETDKLWDGNNGAVIAFTVPSDIEATTVSGQESHWIRARVKEDGYLQFNTGQEHDGSGGIVDPEPGDPVIWEIIHEAVPSFKRLRMDYPPVPKESADDGGNGNNGGPGEPPGVTTGPQERSPQHAVLRNNHSYGVDEARRLRLGSETELRPFRKLPEELTETPKQTLYLGFDAPLDDGPIQMLFSAVDKTYKSEFYPRARWEYRVDPRTDEWAQLSANDTTEGLARRGIVGLVFPEATTESERFGRTRHWIRARLVGEDQFDVVVSEGGARDVPDSGATIRILVDAAKKQVAIENPTDQALGLSGYKLYFNSTEPEFPDDPGKSVVPPSGRLTVGKTGSGADVQFVELDDASLDDPSNVSLHTPSNDHLFTGEEGETAEDEERAAEDETEATVDAIQPCETIGPAVLGTDPRYTTSPPKLRGLYPNTGWADNIRTISDEPLGLSDGSADQTFTFANQPAIDETVWVDELSSLAEDERSALKDKRPEQVNEQTDEDGTVTAFWVKWTAVDNFVESEADARHYVIDRTAGALTFGDGTQGAIPPIGEDNIRASYRTGGGVDGNIQEGTVTALVDALPYVEGIINPDPGWGGADAEPTTAAVERASQTLRDRNRAVTRVDFERLAMSASRGIERVRCIPGMDREGTSRPGWVTVLLVPQTNVPRPMPSPEVKRRVEETLGRHAPAPLTRVQPKQIVVRGPSYLEVIVDTELVVEAGVSSVAAVEEAAADRLEAFLHPLSGGPKDAGWEFGDLPCLSDFYALLERIEGVDHVDSLNVTFRGRDRDHVITDGDERLPRVTTDTLVFSGNHDVRAGGETPETTETSEGVA